MNDKFNKAHNCLNEALKKDKSKCSVYKKGEKW